MYPPRSSNLCWHKLQAKRPCTPSHFSNICQGNLWVHPPPLRFNDVYCDEIVITRLQHCLGRKGLPIPVISLSIVPKIACQGIFVLSDLGVPRTYVVDCGILHWYPSLTLSNILQCFPCMSNHLHNEIHCTSQNAYGTKFPFCSKCFIYICSDSKQFTQ